MDVMLPDGRLLKGVPDGTTKAEIAAKMGFENQEPVETGSDKASLGMGLANAVPYGQRITSGLGALIAKPFTDQPLGDLYDQAQGYGQQTMEDHPYAAGAGTALGIGTTLPLASAKVLGGGQAATQGIRGGINAIPKALSKVGNFARSGKAAKDAGIAAKAGSLALRSAKSGAVSAPIAGLYAAGESDDQLEGFKRGAGLGAGLGSALPLAGAALGGAGKALLPKIDEGLADVAKLAKKHNIPLSIDQITGSRAVKTAQKVSQDLPFSGQATFRDKQLESVNKGLLKTIGMKGNKFSPVQMDKAFTDIGREFDNFGKGEIFDISPIMGRVRDLSIDADDVYGLDARGNLSSMVTKIVKKVNDQSKNGTITGESLGRIRKEINSKMRKTSNFETKSIFADLESSIIDVMSDQNPEMAAAFKNTKHKYKNLLVLEPVASKSKGGNINPTLLNNRVLRIYGRQHTRGKSGDIGEIARIGHELLPELGGSDTLSKSVFAIGAGGGAVAAPVTATTVVAGNRLVQSAINRNQKIINKMISSPKPNLKELSKLPPKDARKVLSFLKQQGVNVSAATSERIKK